jgi:hypothetical protein
MIGNPFCVDECAHLAGVPPKNGANQTPSQVGQNGAMGVGRDRDPNAGMRRKSHAEGMRARDACERASSTGRLKPPGFCFLLWAG